LESYEAMTAEVEKVAGGFTDSVVSRPERRSSLTALSLTLQRND
jgi:hypothetical protein